MKSKLGLIALGTIGLLVASCSNTSSIATPSAPSSTPSSLPPSTSPSSSTLSSSSSSSAQTVVLQNYGYSFVGTTLNASGGSLSANGLTWDYGSLAYAGPGDDRGTQIGSSKKPQTDHSVCGFLPAASEVKRSTCKAGASFFGAADQI